MFVCSILMITKKLNLTFPILIYTIDLNMLANIHQYSYYYLKILYEFLITISRYLNIFYSERIFSVDRRIMMLFRVIIKP